MTGKETEPIAHNVASARRFVNWQPFGLRQPLALCKCLSILMGGAVTMGIMARHLRRMHRKSEYKRTPRDVRSMLYPQSCLCLFLPRDLMKFAPTKLRIEPGTARGSYGFRLSNRSTIFCTSD